MVNRRDTESSESEESEKEEIEDEQKRADGGAEQGRETNQADGRSESQNM